MNFYTERNINMSDLKMVLLLFALVLSTHFNMLAATGTYSVTYPGLPCPGGGTATITITYEEGTARVLRTKERNCAGVIKESTYTYYPERLISTYFPSEYGSISQSGSNISTSIPSKVEIVSITSGQVAYTYPNTVPANTPTPIWSGLDSGLYIFVARDPNQNSTVYNTLLYYHP
jgi:hypothetical protein